MTKQGEICPICGEGHLDHRVEKNEVEYNGHSAQLDCHFSVCDSCGSEQASPIQIRNNKRAMMAFKKQVDGILTGAELKALRQRMGINQSEAAAIFGGGPVAFSKYESDDVMQSEAMDKLLRVAGEFPDVLSSLAQKAGIDILGQSQAAVLSSDPAKYVRFELPIIIETEAPDLKRPKLRLVHSSEPTMRPVSDEWVAVSSQRYASC
ncbi:type II toxin-antitoxin system MqsA family antitoxin [Methylomonas methanica]|uniref:type II toxin-antitoxin system MqsA family antitoxin n=1 Tax=Methylomonas methanica TaxID=421 RepID=UPI0007C90E5F|nr:type II toxin-antitoxin system MqsA family antitoxin [Methylomonas methanica]